MIRYLRRKEIDSAKRDSIVECGGGLMQDMQCDRRLKVMFTAAWYPNRYDKMPGLFIRKHAQAVSRYDDVFVVYAHPDESAPLFGKLKIIREKYENVTEYSVYYPVSTIPLLRKVINFFTYIAAVVCLLRCAFRHEGKPDVCQVNVLTRWGVVAYVLKRVYKIPYLIMEHWTRYLDVTDGYHGLLRKRMTELSAKAAYRIMPVSRDLQSAMEGHGIKGDYEVVENVVDDFFYEAGESKKDNDVKMILHISCFSDRAKNMSGILEAVREVRKQRDDFRLVMVGTGVDFDMTVAKAKEYGLEDVVEFTGEQTPEEVCGWIGKCDFLLMFSNFENAPVVISESLAMGKPVLSSNVGGISEMVTMDAGRLVEAGNVGQLVDATVWMLDHYKDFDAEEIRQRGRKYSFDTVGKKLDMLYREALERG